MFDYEKLGAFYLGKIYDLGAHQAKEDIVLYDSKDLTTHAVIIGMTGSGKTGLAIGLLEEALIDNIPVIAIDPKGDLPNLLLTFPSLRSEDFLPWVDEQDALKKGLTPEQCAAKQAQSWQKGLADWGQSPDRIARLRDAADVAVYTPGSNAGLPVSVLRNFAAPSPGIIQDIDLFRERIQSTTTSLLALLGMDADPITSREHILIANIFESVWMTGKALDLAGLIRAVQNPPYQRIGVIDLESFFPPRERFALAMKLNNLLAAPGFETWLQGPPLDIGRFLYTDSGKPRASIFTISHLSDPERMFFVSTLLNEVLGWMRMQPGTSSLRAVLYMDEIFGYFPPVKNPPSKAPLLTLLKQARAFGLGVVLATQNPVDLDYRGLSNTGTWFIGRLQTEQDKERVLAGLQGAAGSAAFNRTDIEKILSGLEQRVFLLHNVHETEPLVFESRWVLSYLRGPVTRQQIKVLMAERKGETAAPIPQPVMGTLPVISSQGIEPDAVPGLASAPPILPPGIQSFFLPGSGAGQGLVYYPSVMGKAEIHYSDVKLNISADKTIGLAAELSEGPVFLDWDQAREIGFDCAGLSDTPLGGAAFAELPAAAKDPASYRKWSKDFVQWVRQNRPMLLFRSRVQNQYSQPGESEGDFRSRLSQKAREKRDMEVEKLRRKYSSRFTTLKDKLMRAEQAIEREQAQAKSRKLEAAVSFGSAILGAFLGRKAVSSTSAYRMGTAVKSAGRIGKEQMDVARARETAEAVRAQMEDLEGRLQEDIAAIEAAFDPRALDLEEMKLKPKSADIALRMFGLGWLPYRRDAAGRLSPDWV